LDIQVLNKRIEIHLNVIDQISVDLWLYIIIMKYEYIDENYTVFIMTGVQYKYRYNIVTM